MAGASGAERGELRWERVQVWWSGEGGEAVGKFEAPARCSGCPAQKIEQGPSRPSPIAGQSGAFAEQLGDNCCLQAWAALPFFNIHHASILELPFQRARGCRVSESIWLEPCNCPAAGRLRHTNKQSHCPTPARSVPLSKSLSRFPSQCDRAPRCSASSSSRWCSDAYPCRAQALRRETRRKTPKASAPVVVDKDVAQVRRTWYDAFDS